MEGEDEASDDVAILQQAEVRKRPLSIAAGTAMIIILAFFFGRFRLSPPGFSTNKIVKLSVIQFKGSRNGVAMRHLLWRTRLYNPSSDVYMMMYGENGLPKDIVYLDASTGERVTKTITPGKTETRFRLGFSGTSGSNVVDLVEPNSPLEKARVKKGDKIISVDGFSVSSTEDIIEVLNVLRPDKTAPLSITVERNGTLYTFENIQPFSDFQYTLGQVFEQKKGNFVEVIGASVNFSISTIREVITTLGWLFNGTLGFKDLSGPVGIIGTVGSVVEEQQPVSETILNLLYFCAFISINLGVMNLIPFPALDGSILLLLLIEKLRGKPLPPEKMGIINIVGFMLLIGLLIATLFNDIPRWIL
jgi:regulator of sigma E protease